MTPDEVKKAFLDDFRALLAKYNASLKLVDGIGYYPLKKVEFDISAIYDDNGDIVRPWTTFSVGSYFHKDSK